MLLILDTNHLTVIQRQSEPAYSILSSRLANFSPSDVVSTIINVEEQMRGWLSVIASAKNKEKEVNAYHKLHNLLSFFSDFTILEYDEFAAQEFNNLQKLRLKVGTMDLKIAAITISNKAMLLSSNLVDFQKIPHLQVADWTLP